MATFNVTLPDEAKDTYTPDEVREIVESAVQLGYEVGLQEGLATRPVRDFTIEHRTIQ